MDIQVTSHTEPTIIEKLRAQLTGVFSIAFVDVPQPPDRAIRFRGHLQQAPEKAFAELSARFEALDYTPTLARDEENSGQDVLIAVRGVARPRPARARINLVLFIITVFTTLVAGSFYEGGDLLSGAPFAFTLLAILGKHPCRLIVTPTGGQGFLLGRGNQQLSPEVLKGIGRENLIVIATQEKLAELRHQPLLVDTGDPEVDTLFRGYVKIYTGFRAAVMYAIR